MRKFIFSCGIALLAIIGCKEKGAPTPEQLAGLAAQGYYEHLQQGDIDNYLTGISGFDSLPVSHKAELKANALMFLRQQKADHGGICEVKTNFAKTDSTLNVVYAMLNILFADSTNEEVCVPMTEDNHGRWVMK